MTNRWRDLAALVLPAPCAGCGAGRLLLCEACRRALAAGRPRRVRPEPQPTGLPPVYGGAVYAAALRSVLLAHKERGALPLAAPLGAVLAVAVAAALSALGAPARRAPAPAVLLVPMPSRRSAVARRGHDPVHRIALAAAAELRAAGVPTEVHRPLRWTRPTADQGGLPAAARRANLAGALAARRPRPGGWGAPRGVRGVVLVDDVMTTGSSLAEAARALRAAGEEVGPVIGERMRLAAAVVAVPAARQQPAPSRSRPAGGGDLPRYGCRDGAVRGIFEGRDGSSRPGRSP